MVARSKEEHMKKLTFLVVLLVAILVIAAPLASAQVPCGNCSHGIPRVDWGGDGGNSGYYNQYYGQYFKGGVDFKLDLVPKKDRKYVKKGKVTVGPYNKGIVNRYDSWYNGIIGLPPGDYDVKVVVRFPDDRGKQEFHAKVSVQHGEVEAVYLDFDMDKDNDEDEAAAKPTELSLVDQKIATLTAQQDEAVKAKKFAKAAELQDQIDALQKKN